MIRLAPIFVLAFAGCYEPSYPECAVRCGETSECAPAQICSSEGWCVAPDRIESCETPIGVATVVDAAHVIDASDASVGDAQPVPDAAPPPSCAPGCPGTCVAGVCVIQCTAKKSCEVLSCPLTGACRVECVGEESCKSVYCGFGKCTVNCIGKESCRNGPSCGASCGCDVTCSGVQACKDRATCPHPSCRAGDGCTSAGSCSNC